MSGTSPTPRRYRVDRGFGKAPRFVLAVSELGARLTAFRLEQSAYRVIARLSHAA